MLRKRYRAPLFSYSGRRLLILDFDMLVVIRPSPDVYVCIAPLLGCPLAVAIRDPSPSTVFFACKGQRSVQRRPWLMRDM